MRATKREVGGKGCFSRSCNSFAGMRYQARVTVTIRSACDCCTLDAAMNLKKMIQLRIRIKRATHSPTFLVWHRTLCLKKQTIYFGHWDWVCGIFYMLPLLYPILYCLLVCLGTGSPVEKTIITLIEALMVNTLFFLYKSASFDVYQVGSRYFKANGLSYIPRTPKGISFF